MRKGSLTLETIIVAALALIVLVVLAFIFRTQVGDLVKKYRGVSDDLEEQAKGMKCVTLATMSQRQCESSCSAEWSEVPLPAEAKEWKDCKTKKCCEKAA